MKNSLHPKALHGVAGEIVNRILAHSEAHPAAILFQLFTFLGNIIGRGPYWSVEGKRHYLLFFTILVGPTSSGRKGSSLGYLKRIFEPIDPVWFKECIKDGLSSGEGLIFHVRDEAQNDPGVLDKRLLVIEEEFASVLKMVQRDGNTLSTTVRKCWDGENLNVMTKNLPLKASDPHVSIIGHITQAELARHVSEIQTADGFGNRFLPVSVQRSKRLPFGGNLSSDDLNELSAILGKVVTFAREVGELKFRDDACRFWESIYQMLTERPENIFGAMTARAAPQVRKLACMYALFELRKVVTREHLEAAIAAWKYVEDSCRELFGDSTGNRAADKILKTLTHEGSLTRTRIMEKALGNNSSKEELNAALSMLSNLGRIYKVIDHPETWALYDCLNGNNHVPHGDQHVFSESISEVANEIQQ